MRIVREYLSGIRIVAGVCSKRQCSNGTLVFYTINDRSLPTTPGPLSYLILLDFHTFMPPLDRSLKKIIEYFIHFGQLNM